MRSHDLWTRWFSESRANYDAVIAERSAAMVAKAPDKYSLQEIDELLRRFCKGRTVSADAVQRLEAADDEDVTWLTDALRDQEGKWFVVALAGRAKTLPAALFAPMLLAGIDDDGDGSFKKSFVEPWGNVEAGHFLIDQFELQSGPRRLSVLSCLYFASWGMPTDEEGRYLRERKLTVLVQTFATETDAATRRLMLREIADVVAHSAKAIPIEWPPEVSSWAPRVPDSLHCQLRQIAESVQHDSDPETREQFRDFAGHVEALSIKGD